MSLPRDSGRDLSLEQLRDRDGRRPSHLGESALVSETLGPQAVPRDHRTAYEALIDAVFAGPGAVEWLFALRRAVTALLNNKDEVIRPPVQPDAIRQAEPGQSRG
jgi:hypothetical protein